MSLGGSFLTDWQIQVELRLLGYSRDQIAEVLRTVRANITLKDWEHLQSPVSLMIAGGPIL